MKVIPIAVLLIVTLVFVPIFTYFIGTALSSLAIRALWTTVSITAVAIAGCFFVSELTGNHSQVDKLWSLLPIAYAWVFASFGHFGTRLTLMAVLVTAWGVRLTFNFWLKGGYRWKFWEGEEDYRWEIVRRKPEFQSRWRWSAFNLFFISTYQQTLILLFTLPALVALQFHDQPLGMIDFLAAAAMALFIVFEAIADWQHWKFQSRKASQRINGNGDPTKGFLDQGLWALSRHPNYFAEQMIWISFYFFSVSASGQWLNWSITGCLLLVILFQGSSTLSEEISASKYPEFADYQRRVPRFIPLRILAKSRKCRFE